MESYGKLLLYYAFPYFTISMLVELLYARWKGEHIRLMDSVSSLSSGMANILKDTLKLSVAIISYSFLLKYVHMFTWDKAPVWMYLFCFMYIDFTGYWVHRIEHTVNYFWNHHIIHHSSEEFNLACALRQSISDLVGFFTVFYLPMALVGVPTAVIGIVAPVHLFMQFWYHTRYINRMGVLEKVIVTPSHHRVHHAMNDIYLDKNYGQIFIFWDKLFNTYQEELADVPPVYGVKRPVKTWNPFIINFKHLFLLASDAWRTKSYKDKLRIWIMPTGWRPADVAEKYPVTYIEDVTTYEKHDPVYSKAFVGWSFFQMFCSLALLSFFFYRMGRLPYMETMLYGGFLMLAIFANTALMDKKAYGVIACILLAAFGVGIILLTGDWFGVKNIWPAATSVLIAYLAATAIASVFFMVYEFSKEEESEMVMVGNE